MTVKELKERYRSKKYLTVEELIKELQKLDPKKRVVIQNPSYADDEEWDYFNICSVEEKESVFTKNQGYSNSLYGYTRLYNKKERKDWKTGKHKKEGEFTFVDVVVINV